MKPGQESKVQVILKLRHGTVNYTLMREQTYRKDYSNRVKGDNTVFDIAIKDANGNTSYVKKSQCESEVKGILPKELSRYFFFDGERIEKMSKDISTGKKATDFAEAVKGLLGLNAMYSAIQHFNPKSRLGVIGSYESSYDSHSNSKIQEYTQTIERCKSEIAKIDARLEELEGQIEQASARKAEKTEEIKQYAEGEELQRQKERLIQKIARAKDSKANIFHRLQFLLGGGKLSDKLGVGCFQLVIFRLQGIQIDIQIHALLLEIAERFVEAVKLVLVAFCKRCLSSFPADFQILVMNRLVGLAGCHGVLNAGNDLHAGRCFLHSGVDALGFLTHSLQGGIQIFQREKLMRFQIDHCFGDCLQIIDRAFLLSVS